MVPKKVIDVAAIKSEPIAHADLRRPDPAGEIPTGLGFQHGWLEPFDLDRDLATARRPETEVNAAIGPWLGADRQAANQCIAQGR